MIVNSQFRQLKKFGWTRVSGRVPSLAAIFMASTMFVCAFDNEVIAQTASFRSVDTNRDGILDRGELEAAFGRAGALTLLSIMDRNGDGRITILELRASQDDRPSTNDNEGDEDDQDDDKDEDDDGDDDDGGDSEDGDDGDDDD